MKIYKLPLNTLRVATILIAPLAAMSYNVTKLPALVAGADTIPSELIVIKDLDEPGSPEPVQEPEPVVVCGNSYLSSPVGYTYTTSDIKTYAAHEILNRFGCDHIESFMKVIHKESSWVVNTAHYSDGKSSAHGLAGFLNMTWSTVGCTKTNDQYVQIDCAIKYIANRYGTPKDAAWHHHLNNWY